MGFDYSFDVVVFPLKQEICSKNGALQARAMAAPHLTLETASRLATPAHPLKYYLICEYVYSIASIT